MTTIYLIRHAEAEGNLYRRAHGWYNSTITDRGYRQIAALTKRFTDTKFDAVYSSDRFRTMITALSIYKTHGLPLRTVRTLREIDVGYWEDTPWAELERIDPEQLAYFSNDSQKWHVDGCESFAEVRDRMRKVLTEIAEAHPNGTVAVFSHGMAMRIIVGTLQGMTLHEIDRTGHAENTAVAKLEYENGTFNVIFRDDASHLGDNIATDIKGANLLGVSSALISKGVHVNFLGEGYIPDVAKTRELATAWNLFFNEVSYEEFKKQQLYDEMETLLSDLDDEVQVAQSSVYADCDAILRTYMPAKETNPEEKNASPFGKLGLLKNTEGTYYRKQPDLNKLPEDIVWFLLVDKGKNRTSVYLDDLWKEMDSPGKILQLKRTALIEMLERLEEKDKIVMNRTAGLNMIYWEKGLTGEMIVKNYYER